MSFFGETLFLDTVFPFKVMFEPLKIRSVLIRKGDGVR